MSLTTILIEDSKTIRDNLIPALEFFLEAEVVAVGETVDQALEMLSANGWRLAVVDLFLKEGSGLTVLRAVRNRSSEQHVVVLTNYPTPDMRARCLALGADAVFDKSTELELFFEHCQRYR
jgi:DNA-binding NarL/FixJ family response regulator